MKNKTNIVTRFPPSPTGFLHIGNARTALFNWLYAKHTGGKFVVRIEDTDRERYKPEYVDAILRTIEWMGLDYDGEIVSQYEQRERHKEVAEQMVAKGQAYYCYCSPEELEAMREKAKADGAQTFYDRRWRDRDPADAPAGVKPVIRIKAPIGGETTVHDQVQGEVTVKNDQLDDFIILRSDGVPTYMLAVVVDDYDMGITHVIRGNDHLNNAFRQNVIYDAMGWDKPVYAHLPLIVGADGAKLSKRHGAVSVEDYREKGFLPEAVNNYLLKLGWGHGDDEIIPRDQAIALFDLDGVHRSAARFDETKFTHINSHYLKQADAERLISDIKPIYQEQLGITLTDQSKTWIKDGMDELKERAETLHDLVKEARFYAQEPPYILDEKSQATLSEGQAILAELAKEFELAEDFSAENVKNICQKIAETHAGGKLGKVGMPLRVALTGTTSSPTIFNVAAILGKDVALRRISAALQGD